MIKTIKNIAFTIYLISTTNALVLENLIADKTLEQTLSNKKVGYYIGSFDPLHLGHENVAHLTIDQKLCDYVLVYSNWGGDKYKNRADITLRHDMIFSAFANHPYIIVTRLSPQDLQRQFTRPTLLTTAEGKTLVDVAIPGLEFIGIVGSDTALSTANSADSLRIFMRGIQIPEKHYNTTIGGVMALPVKSFIVSMRTGDDISSLNHRIGDRPILTIINSDNECGLSSTAVKKAIKAGTSIEGMVSTGVERIIKENKLYH